MSDGIFFWSCLSGLAFHEDLTLPVTVREAEAVQAFIHDQASQVLPGVSVDLMGGFRRWAGKGEMWVSYRWLSTRKTALAVELRLFCTYLSICNTLRLRQNGQHFADDVFFYAFPSLKMMVFWLNFHWSLLLCGLVPNSQQAVIWTNDSLVFFMHMCHPVSMY